MSCWEACLSIVASMDPNDPNKVTLLGQIRAALETIASVVFPEGTDVSFDAYVRFKEPNAPCNQARTPINKRLERMFQLGTHTELRTTATAWAPKYTDIARYFIKLGSDLKKCPHERLDSVWKNLCKVAELYQNLEVSTHILIKLNVNTFYWSTTPENFSVAYFLVPHQLALLCCAQPVLHNPDEPSQSTTLSPYRVWTSTNAQQLVAARIPRLSRSNTLTVLNWGSWIMNWANQLGFTPVSFQILKTIRSPTFLIIVVPAMHQNTALCSNITTVVAAHPECFFFFFKGIYLQVCSKVAYTID
jgi:hypothetical protein